MIVRNNRGYNGWYTTIWNDKIYLRSSLEFITAKWLDSKNFYFLSECEIFDNKYKPDFFVYDKNKNLKMIIEVKYSKNEWKRYITKYYNYFKNKNIKYIVIYKKHLDRISKRFSLENEIKEWKKKSIFCCSENHNPHFGFKHSDESKNLIGEKTKERFKDDNFRKKHSESIKKSYIEKPELKEKLSRIMKERTNSSLERWKLFEKNLKYIRILSRKICKCGKHFIIYEEYDDNLNFMHNLNLLCDNIIKGDFCSKTCYNKFLALENILEKRKKRIEKQIESFFKFYEINKVYPNRKEFNEFSKLNNYPNDIRKTFGTYTEFLNFMEENYNICCKRKR